jgi:hypothetical protein
MSKKASKLKLRRTESKLWADQARWKRLTEIFKPAWARRVHSGGSKECLKILTLGT